MEVLFGGGQAELLGWFVRNQIADAVEALSTENFTNWIMERNVRRPSGRKALDFYHDPLCHGPISLQYCMRLALFPETGCLKSGTVPALS